MKVSKNKYREKSVLLAISAPLGSCIGVGISSLSRFYENPNAENFYSLNFVFFLLLFLCIQSIFSLVKRVAWSMAFENNDKE